MRREATGHTLQTTAVIHEAYLRMAKPGRIDWQNRTHFFAVAAMAMRRVLVDHARTKLAMKRGGTLSIETLDFEPASFTVDPEEITTVDAALRQLAELDERSAKIVELRYFAGLTIEETAEALGVSPRTVKRGWRLARAWLIDHLNGHR